jgi:hypothetical protein
LDDDEYYLADGGYYDGNQWSDTPKGLHDFDQRQKAAVRARHETANSRFKQWNILSSTYRHRLTDHSAVFRAIACITQLGIINGEPLFGVEYNDNDHF